MLIKNTFFFYPSQFCWQSLNLKSIFVFFSNSGISDLVGGGGGRQKRPPERVEPLRRSQRLQSYYFAKGIYNWDLSLEKQ